MSRNCCAESNSAGFHLGLPDAAERVRLFFDRLESYRRTARDEKCGQAINPDQWDERTLVRLITCSTAPVVVPCRRACLLQACSARVR